MEAGGRYQKEHKRHIPPIAFTLLNTEHNVLEVILLEIIIQLVDFFFLHTFKMLHSFAVDYISHEKY